MRKFSETDNNQYQNGNASHAEIRQEKNIAGAVNRWISEYRENRLAEKSFSDERITAWKTVSSPSESD